MVGFLDNFLKSARDWALAPKPNNLQSKPQSIVVKFRSYRTKEEVLQRAWQKGKKKKKKKSTLTTTSLLKCLSNEGSMPKPIKS